MIDVHCHLTDEKFKGEIGEIIVKARGAGVKAMVNNAGNLEESRRGVELAEKYEEVWTTVGIHPDEIFNLQFSIYNQLLNLTNHKKVVAVGETGLDFRNGITGEEKERQTELFRWNLELAKEAGLPVVVHCRNAFAEVFEIVESAGITGQMHCFTGSMDWMNKFADAGWYISFGGIITFKKSRELREVVRAVPEDKILIETDAPYLSPEPVRGERNEPANIVRVAEVIAEERGVTLDDVCRFTATNAVRLFSKLKL